MSIRSAIALWIYIWMNRIARNRPCDVTIGGNDDPYMRRWFIIPRNPIFNIYLHQFLRSDDDRALHDHPWLNLSFLLRGRYVEHTIAQGGINHRVERKAGDYKFRTPRSAHRVELIDGECWTLFITGPRLRRWGFHCPNGWIPWEVFTNPADGGRTVGPGCDALPDVLTRVTEGDHQRTLRSHEPKNVANNSLAHGKKKSEHAGSSV